MWKNYFVFSLPTLPTLVYWDSTKLKWLLSWVLASTYSSLERSIIVQENSQREIVLLIDSFVHYLWALKHFTIVSRTCFLVLLLFFAFIVPFKHFFCKLRWMSLFKKQIQMLISFTCNNITFLVFSLIFFIVNVIVIIKEMTYSTIRLAATCGHLKKYLLVHC